MTKKIRIGTRGSQLALVQANMVADGLRAHNPGLETEIVIIKTSGDWKPEQGETYLSEAQGGKGLFAREIEQALLENRVDCGVHSLKDMPSFLPDGLVIDHVLPREDARDVFVSARYKSLAELPKGAIVGTASPRRQAFLLAKRPDLKIEPLRGNVPTRLEKLKAGQADATILALAGLKRLHLEREATAILDPADMLPAAAQGIIGIETRANDSATRALLDPLHHRETGLRALAERAALQVLGGSCRTAIGAHAALAGDTLHLTVGAATPDGGKSFFETIKGPAKDAAALGEQAGRALKAKLPPGFLD
jgi:hydroxymethylbilane synthase